VRSIRRASLLAIGLLLAAAPAALAGPGITFYPKAGPVLQLSGGQIAASADLPARTFTLPDDSATPGKKVTLRGLSIRAIVARSGQSAGRVQVVNSHGGSFVVTPAQFGSAFISDDGSTTRFIRSQGGFIADYTEDSAVALEVSVDGGDLAITAKANRKRVKVGEPVTFTASVRYGVPGVQYSFEWDFGEGPVAGKSVNYSPEIAGTLFGQVEVRNPDPGCTIRCGGTEQVAVEVGEAPKEPEAPTAGGANGTPGGAGSSGASGGGGSGSGAGGAGGAGTNPGGEDTSEPAPAKKAAPQPKPDPKPKPKPKPFGPTITGVLINDTGTNVRKLPAGEPAGAAEGVRAVNGGDPPGSVPLALGGLLAVAVMWVGALRERRDVRLRVA
jgi:hypothetical protein